MSLREFANVCERLYNTNSKKEKISILAEYLINLSDDDLKVATTFLSNRVFPRGSEYTLNIGYNTIWSIIQELTPLSNDKLLEEYKKYGDLGKVAEKAFNNLIIRPLSTISLTLSYVFNTLLKIAKVSGVNSMEEKKRILKGLLINCTPLEAKYLIKVILNELRIGLEEGLLEHSIAIAFNTEVEKVRRALLLNGDIGYVTLLAKYSRLDELNIVVGKPINFMLADTIFDLKEIDKEVIVEYKYDGIRVQLHKGKDIKLFSRNLEDITSSFPEIVNAVSKIDHEFILDGELVMVSNGKYSFKELQRRLKSKNLKEDSKFKTRYIVYDILYLDGSLLIDLPLYKRKEILNSTIKTNELVHVAEYKLTKIKNEIEDMFKASKELGHEGIMIKDPESKYQVGKRGKYWLKLKHQVNTLSVVIVAAEYGHGKRATLLSDYVFAVRDKDGLKVIGKAYSGLKDVEIRELTNKLKELTIKDEGYRIIVKPEIVLEVAFDSISISDRYDSNFALRFPRIKGIRYDKSVEDIDTLEKVKELYNNQMKLT